MSTVCVCGESGACNTMSARYSCGHVVRIRGGSAPAICPVCGKGELVAVYAWRVRARGGVPCTKYSTVVGV